MTKVNTVKGFLKEEKEGIKDIAIIDKTKYKPLKQNQISDNITKGLLEPKQLSIFDGSATTNLNTKKKQEFVLTIEKFEELENILSNELYNNHKTNQSVDKLLVSI